MIFIALGIVLLIGAAVLIWMALTAPDGWEDADGFHTGTEPFRLPRTEAEQDGRGAAIGFYQINEHGQPDSRGGV